MIYLDNNATTPVDPRVLKDMLPFFTEQYANPASGSHAPGNAANEALEEARAQISRALGAESREIIFTSGATEACNLAIKGIHDQYAGKGRHIIVAETEHKAVLDPVQNLGRSGADISILPVDSEGLIDLEALESLIRDDTILVAIMWANNETGVIQPMREIGQICASKGTLLFCDATQVVGKVRVNPREAGIQLMAFNAHKMHGPKGVGALYMSARSPKLRINPMLHGGGHEAGYRSGTVNLPGVIGLASALECALTTGVQEEQRVKEMRDTIERDCIQQLGARVNGSVNHRMSHVSNLSIPGVDATALLERLGQTVALSTGSACTSADPQVSHVLTAMGLSTSAAESSLRISMSRMNTQQEIAAATDLIISEAKALLRN